MDPRDSLVGDLASVQESIVMPEDDSINNRTQAFRRNANLESALDQLNRLLSGPESDATRDFSEPALPLLFFVGNARSGTTLALQWLAASGEYGYPTNLLSRFYRAPYVGGLIQKVLTDPSFSFRDELGEFSHTFDFSSIMGKTQGALAPHEFWYFWRRFFPSQELCQFDESEVTPETIAELRRELAAIESQAARPLAMKAMHMNFNLKFFSKIFPRALFVHIERHPLYNMQSLLEARVRQFGSVDHWYSVKPPEYGQLANLSPIEQVAGQVYFTNRHVTKALACLPSNRSFTIAYEKLCETPARIFADLADQVSALGWNQAMQYRGPAEFPSGNQLRFSSSDLSCALTAWKELSGTTLAP